ncbi:class II aldolase/adducin family protein [Roseomonas sp. KE0001]|uniref:class II aldolase/adducin family protein n=1 Tax=Roseomonas sp. KE0001 TaxID=2479201 RepID=UPI0018DFAE1A|nr:class II aldolase/adducin family protein [Roseomonas sp. KE0001]MBI0432667.1 aldolase [Roseomonas sp. KE0001]
MSAMVQSLASSAAEEREWALRCDMAAVFRVAARLGWNEQIGNHNSLMLPDEAEPRFLINPRGYLFQELKASDLIVCDLDGRVLRGSGELRKVAFHIHARIHVQNPAAACVVHVHPRWLTALSLLRDAEFALSHHNNLLLNDRMVYDREGDEPVHVNEEGDRIARLMGDKSIMVMRGHGVTVVGPTVADAFDECYMAERTAMYQMTALQTGQPLHRLPEGLRRHHHGPWGERMDARLHLDAWRRILDREEPDYAR